MGLFNSFNISASGMTAERLRTDVIANNIANSETTRTSNGGPYVRQTLVFEEKRDSVFKNVFERAMGDYNGTGVKVDAIIQDTSTPVNLVYDPDHPDADENGYVTYPNVNIVTEMTNLIDATRAYEANVTAFNASKAIASKGLEIADS
ncbi:MAG: flagellar basal body rod protein FlgC [Lachnospiraceae bacterium]|nr:flagellar basal body rod protein FlgC [Lachnospiraceae bacterium]